MPHVCFTICYRHCAWRFVTIRHFEPPATMVRFAPAVFAAWRACANGCRMRVVGLGAADANQFVDRRQSAEDTFPPGVDQRRELFALQPFNLHQRFCRSSSKRSIEYQ